MASQARLRYRVFVEGRELPHDQFNGMEYDPFDTPAATYLVWRDESQNVRGLIRLLLTTRSYMLQTYWPHLVRGDRLPSSPYVQEITRVCVDKSFDPRQRVQILPRLLCGVQELFQRNGVRKMIGVARPHLVTTFIKSGVEWLGEPSLIEGEVEAAFTVPTEYIRPIQHCRKYGIEAPVLSQLGLDDWELAA
ncbi:MAG: acyl-homoserine-lactone synthase [Alphaproteobacteria bacterium]|nr:acyl-homoserine-lactone synthase [Alphaproteobacteria bacterium]